MSRKIAIVGAGQSGLPLALRLQARGDQVTLISNRSAEDIRQGKVMSSQCMFNAALDIERQAGLASWEAECPPVEGISLTVPHPGEPGAKLIDWAARLDRPAQAVDQRLKMPVWMNLFESRGGQLIIQEVGIPELENLAASHDLTIVSAGKGEITRLFERDAVKSLFDAPQRALALTYVTGMQPMTPYSRVCFNLIPGVGEYFVFPALTETGPCEIMVFEGIPGGPMDCWADIRTPTEHLARSRQILAQFLPWEADRCQRVELTDANGTLAGRFAPTVRKPVGRLPSGRHVLGMGDAVCVNDPITGQGSNNATKCFDIYHRAIVERGDGAFDATWMQSTFDLYWDYAQHVVRWTNTLLAPPPEHILKLLGAAGQCAPLARTIVNNFDHPPGFFPWWADPTECDRFIADKMREAA
jgi:hypothetical protein